MYNTNAQDLFANEYRVYIDGVEIPFESASIHNVYKQLPTATITLPPWPGLQELGRNYAPKVNIFWRDYNFGVVKPDAQRLSQDPEYTELDYVNTNVRDARNDSWKLIFSGVITSTSDSKFIEGDSAGQSISFKCEHPIKEMKNILVRYGNSRIPASQAQIDPEAQGAASVNEWDAYTLMIKALNGVRVGDGGTVNEVTQKEYDSLKGTPGMIYVMWKALVKDAARATTMGHDADILTKMYIPLIETGLAFWERLTGHASIESGVDSGDGRVNLDQKDVKEGVNDLPENVMIPGVFRSFIGDAAQKQLAISAMQSSFSSQGSPEAVSFMDTMLNLLERLEYELCVLSAPISKADGSIKEYVMKPQLANYYAPLCNAVLPNLVSRMDITSDFGSIPTRSVNITNLLANINGASSGGPSSQYTSPHSVRYSRAGGEAGDLKATLGAYTNKAGRYEYGSGVKAFVTQLPTMYNVLEGYFNKKDTEDTPGTLAEGTRERAAAAWDAMYPVGKWPGALKYNPLRDDSGILPFQRLNFMYADQQFATATARARTCQASGPFNPYPVVGYPMDIVDPVPSRESYHGLCTSITHSFHASGQSNTSYSMASVMSFSELALYNIPAINPYLSAVFDMDEDARIYRNRKAYEKACQVYMDVFGVGAAEPGLLQDYETGTTINFGRKKGSGCWSTDVTSYSTGSRSTQFLDTIQGSLMLVARNITSMKELADSYGDVSSRRFIHMEEWIDATEVTVVDNPLKVKISPSDAKIPTAGLDPESSPFLSYTEW